jgi:hypothetical protein
MIRFHRDGTLPTNGEFFVFGSNLAGIHGAGAAKVAREMFAAERGVGIGPTGHSYAIPTKDKDFNVRDLQHIYFDVQVFCQVTKFEPEKKWFVTRVGCGLAGFSDSQIAPMFKEAINCSFAEQWKAYL